MAAHTDALVTRECPSYCTCNAVVAHQRSNDNGRHCLGASPVVAGAIGGAGTASDAAAREQARESTRSTSSLAVRWMQGKPAPALMPCTVGVFALPPATPLLLMAQHLWSAHLPSPWPCRKCC